jgi:hypothetical protein
LSKARKSSNQKIEPSPKTLIVRGLSTLIDAAAKSLSVVPENDVQRINLLFLDAREWGSMQLTKLGWNVLRKEYPHWTTELPERMTFGDHTFLIETSTYPYYLYGKRFTTFDADLGLTMKFVGGEFAKLRRLR